jgi:hypothetical protein
MRFLSTEHEIKLMELIQRDGTHPRDKERISLFYILSGNNDLYAKSRSVYDFSQQQIIPDCLDVGSVDFCSSSRALIRLGYNWYNSYQDSDTSPISILSGLDEDNYFRATESLGVRFGHSYQVQSTLDDDEVEL